MNKRNTAESTSAEEVWSSKECQQNPQKTLDYYSASEDELKSAVDRLTTKYIKA